MNPLFGLPGIASTGAVSRRKKGKPKSSGFKLAIVGGHIVKQPKGPAPLSASDKELLTRLTTLHRYRMPYKGEQRGELFIHWFYRDRKVDQLSLCEIFHLNMLQYFNVLDRVEVIHIRCASPNLSPTAAMLCAIEILSAGKATVDFKCVLPKDNWEHDTIKEAAEYAAATEKYVYYTHFKGASRVLEGNLIRSGREINPLNVLYWSYIMYEGLFSSPAGTYGAIGPIACNRVNKEYLFRDLSWSTQPEYQYIGSFQAFDGKALADAFGRLGLNKGRREKFIWWGGRYTVEMFLCLVFLEHEVHAIAQMENESTAYNMYGGKFCPQILERFKSLYESPCTPSCKGEGVAICAVAKGEDLYLGEWIAHYLAMGVKHIYLYDNNDSETEAIKAISKDPNVTVIPVRGTNALRAHNNQVGIYDEAYRTYGAQYEWMGFFDIDEFVTIDDTDIPGFLSSPMYEGVSVVHLNWRYHGDNGLVHYDPSPVHERFAQPSPIDVKYSDLDNMENSYVKSFVHTGMQCVQIDIHSPRFFGALCRNAVGKFQYASKTLVDIEHCRARVEHYGTKTIEEYIRRRIPNGKDSVNGATGGKRISAKDRLDWFFHVNEMTSEKLQVIHEMLPDVKYP